MFPLHLSELCDWYTHRVKGSRIADFTQCFVKIGEPKYAL